MKEEERQRFGCCRGGTGRDVTHVRGRGGREPGSEGKKQKRLLAKAEKEYLRGRIPNLELEAR